MPRIPLMRRRITRIELNGLLVFRLGTVPVPAIKIQSVGQRGVSLAEAGVQYQRLGRSCRGLRESIQWRKHAILPIARYGVRVSQAGICFRITWIDGDRAPEIIDCRSEALSGPLVPEVTAFQIGFVGVRVHRPRLGKRQLFLWIQGGANLPGDGAGYPALEHERVPDIFV